MSKTSAWLHVVLCHGVGSLPHCLSTPAAAACWQAESLLRLLKVGATFMAVRENQQVLANECMHLCRMHRRKTMVVQQSVELVLQFVNVALYLVPNVHSLVQKCQWGSNVVGAQHAPLQTDL